MQKNDASALCYPVTAGMVHEISVVLATSDKEAALVQAYLHFSDAEGDAVDIRLLTTAQTVPHLTPLDILALPETIPAAVRATGAVNTRFFIAPPDTVQVTLNITTPGVTVSNCNISVSKTDWRKAAKSELRTRQARTQAQLKLLAPYLPQTLTGDQWRQHFDVPDRQADAIAAQFRRAGNWGRVIDRLDNIAEAIDFNDRVARLGARRKSTDTDICVGFIGQARTYDQLRCLGKVFWLREDSFADQLDMMRPEIVIVETAPESGPGDWFYALSALNGTLPKLGQQLSAALKSRNVPLHLYVTDAPIACDTWRAMLARADKTIIAADAAQWSDAAPKGAVFVPRTTEPAAIPAVLLQTRDPDLLLVPGGSDIFEFPAFADLLKTQSLQDMLVAEFHYGFGMRALIPRLETHDFRYLPDLSQQQQSYLLRNASLVLLNGQTLRNDGCAEDLVLDTIAAGGIPVVFGTPQSPCPVFTLLPQVSNVQDLTTLQHNMRNVWWRECYWRRLYRYVMRHHRLKQADRIALLGRDPCPPDFDVPQVSVVLVTRRPHLIEKCLKAFRDQTWPNTELMLVLNMDEMPSDLPELKDNEAVFIVPVQDSIGRALNLGIDASTGQFWTKMDDDDFYSRTYLEEYVYYYHATQADSLGRQAIYFYFAGLDTSAARLHLQKRSLSPLGDAAQLLGPTLSARKDSDIPAFSNRYRNTADALWIRKLQESQNRVFSYDATSCVIYRDADESNHTWKMSVRADIMQNLEPLCAGNIFNRLEKASGAACKGKLER